MTFIVGPTGEIRKDCGARDRRSSAGPRSIFPVATLCVRKRAADDERRAVQGDRKQPGWKHDVSRRSIREAVKVLSAKGLLQARVGVRVRDRGSEISSVRRFSPCFPTSYAMLITSLMEARRVIAPVAAALTAKRATVTDLARIEHTSLGMRRSRRQRRRCKSQPCPQTPDRDDQGSVACDLAIADRRLATAQSRALSAHRAVFECIRLRDADGPAWRPSNCSKSPHAT